MSELLLDPNTPAIATWIDVIATELRAQLEPLRGRPIVALGLVYVDQGDDWWAPSYVSTLSPERREELRDDDDPLTLWRSMWWPREEQGEQVAGFLPSPTGEAAIVAMDGWAQANLDPDLGFRQLMVTLAWQLNRSDWRPPFGPTDDFVVYAHEFDVGAGIDEDFAAAVPPERIALLAARGIEPPRLPPPLDLYGRPLA